MAEFNTNKGLSGKPAAHLSKGPLINLESQKDSERRPWIIGKMSTPAGDIPVVGTRLSLADRFGSWKARWGLGRMNFRVEPGLYAVGKPDDKSPVFVSANYKMSFDRLRASLATIDGWIMVLDTKGINVWCAAGKGTFGTEEIIARIKITGLETIISHRRIILPQLGAPGVSAHTIKDRSGFKVIFGPIRADDIPAFMQAGQKATADMRRVRFGLWDRIILIPNDLIASIKYPIMAAIVLFLLAGLGPDIFSVSRMLNRGPLFAATAFIIYFTSYILPILLLPILPGRAFSVKGAWAGVVAGLLLGWFIWGKTAVLMNIPVAIAWLIIFATVSSFVAMNFTGSSTYTSFSGVLKEMRVALPAQIVAAVMGVVLLIIGVVL